MSAANVFLTVTDPDLLIAGNSPYASFAVAKVQLLRYASEAAARADATGGSGALVTTFTLVASSTAPQDPNVAGPWRFGTYDAPQAATSWYRYRFADAGAITFSKPSEPWQAQLRAVWALRDIIFEIGHELGGIVKRGVATAGATNTVTVPSIFKSTLADAHFFDGWCLVVSQSHGGAGAAPENEFALIASNDPTSGLATLERDLSASMASGDTVMASSLIDVDEMIPCINRAREQMEFEAVVDIALSDKEDRYPAPYGLKSELDVIECVGIRQYANSNREDEFEIDYRVVGDGTRWWLEFPDVPGTTPVARLTLLRNYRDLEGNLSLMSDTTACPIEWMRPAFSYAVAEFLADLDPGEQMYAALKTKFAPKAAEASRRYGPKVQRRAKKGQGRRVLPGPVEAR